MLTVSTHHFKKNQISALLGNSNPRRGINMENNKMMFKQPESSLRYYCRAVIFLAFLMSLSKAIAQNDPDGFISIDCGSNVTRSPYAGINLTWTHDEDYIFTGEKGAVQYELNSSVMVNREALGTFRYFPQKRSKYCYELPMKASNISFLIRAMFLHGSSSELPLPISFDVYVNATHWITVNYAEGDDLFTPKVKESIFFIAAGGNRTNVCLVPIKGVPFISSLELRQLDPEGVMYSESFENGLSKGLFFSNLIRLNAGAQDNAPTLRYPDDPYDRLWVNPGWSGPTTQRNLSLGPELNNVPLKVMEDAWYGAPGSRYFFHIDLPDGTAGSQTYCIFYFAQMNASSGDTGEENVIVYLGSSEYPAFNLTNLPVMESYFHILDANYTGLTLPQYALINALEFYELGSIIAPTTAPYDVEVINFLKTTFNLTDWQGDPCTPVPHDWIKCEFEYYGANYWNIVSLNLTHLENSTRLTQLGDIHPATQWDTGCSLHDLAITQSNVDSSTFQSLLEYYLRAAVPLLETLDLSHNDISVLPDSQIWTIALGSSPPMLYSLNLSFNNFSEFPLFYNFSFSKTLQIMLSIIDH